MTLLDKNLFLKNELFEETWSYQNKNVTVVVKNNQYSKKQAEKHWEEGTQYLQTEQIEIQCRETESIKRFLYLESFLYPAKFTNNKYQNRRNYIVNTYGMKDYPYIIAQQKPEQVDDKFYVFKEYNLLVTKIERIPPVRDDEDIFFAYHDEYYKVIRDEAENYLQEREQGFPNYCSGSSVEFFDTNNKRMLSVIEKRTETGVFVYAGQNIEYPFDQVILLEKKVRKLPKKEIYLYKKTGKRHEEGIPYFIPVYKIDELFVGTQIINKVHEFYAVNCDKVTNTYLESNEFDNEQNVLSYCDIENLVWRTASMWSGDIFNEMQEIFYQLIKNLYKILQKKGVDTFIALYDQFIQSCTDTDILESTLLLTIQALSEEVEI